MLSTLSAFIPALHLCTVGTGDLKKFELSRLRFCSSLAEFHTCKIRLISYCRYCPHSLQVLQYVVYLADSTTGGTLVDLANFSDLGALDTKGSNYASCGLRW